MYVDHLTAERAVRVEARGRIKDEWDLPGGKDNHYWDTLVGAAVAASICGIKKEIESEQRAAQQPQRRVVGKRVAPLKL